jgi:hypothetical protein
MASSEGRRNEGWDSGEIGEVKHPQCSARGVATGTEGADDAGSFEHLSPAQGEAGTVGASSPVAPRAPAWASSSRWADPTRFAP